METRKLEGDRDYFTLNEDEFTLNKIEREAIKRAINESGQQMVTTELQFVQPKIKRYALNIVLRYFENYDKDLKVKQLDMNLNLLTNIVFAFVFSTDIKHPIAKFFIKPELPPSGVSTGHTYPHWVAFNFRGPTIFIFESIGVCILRKCEMVCK